MNKFIIILSLFLSFTFILISCRPKDLEGAFVAYNASRFDDAFDLAKKATELYPQNSEAWYLLGMLYSKKDSVAKMVTSFDKSLNIDNTKGKEIEAEKFSTYAKKFNSGANGYNNYNNQVDKTSEDAIKIMQNAINDFNDSYLCKPDFNALLYAGQGYTLLKSKDEATALYNKLIDIYPDSSSSWLAIGRFNFDEGNFSTAVENLKKATELNSTNSEAFTLLAHSFQYLKQNDKAIATYEEALVLNPADANSFFNLGRLYYILGIEPTLEEKDKLFNLENAIKNFATSIDLDPESQNAYQLKGNAELLLSKWEEAKNTLERGVDLFPDDKQMWGDLATAYARLDDKKKGNAALKRYEEL